MIWSKSFVAAALCYGMLSGLASAASSEFKLYAYGDDMHGAPLVYKNGLAYVMASNSSTSNSTYMPVKFTSGTDSTATSWVANPDNSTSSPTASNATWSNQMLYIPSNSSQVGFTSSPNDGEQTNVFRFMSGTVLVQSGDIYTAPFYAVPIDNNTYELRWNDTNGSHVTLRNVNTSDSSSSKRGVSFIA